MTEERYRLHDTLVKWLSLLMVIAGFYVAVRTYIAQQDETREQNKQFDQARRDQADKDARAREEEYKRRIWERQLDLYLQACKAASTLATISDIQHVEYQAARIRFEQLYHGELCVVESPGVEATMVEFRRALLAAEKQPTEASRTGLYKGSLRLAQACRQSTESVWNVKLGELKLKYVP